MSNNDEVTSQALYIQNCSGKETEKKWVFSRESKTWREGSEVTCCGRLFQTRAATDKISETGAEWHVDCGDVVEIETRCRIPIWRTIGRIPWHVISEPLITLQDAATWWIHCHDSRARCHIAGCKNSICYIENRSSLFFIFFWFLIQFRLWRAAAFVSSPIYLLYFTRVYWQYRLMCHVICRRSNVCNTLE